jgi:hypothetical protein
MGIFLEEVYLNSNAYFLHYIFCMYFICNPGFYNEVPGHLLQ